MNHTKQLALLITGAVLSTFCLHIDTAQAHIEDEINNVPTAKSEKVLIESPDAYDRPVYSVTSGITTFLAYDGETNGVFSLFRDVIAPGNGAIPHLHTRQDEIYYILNGTANVITGSKNQIVQAGDFVFLPKGIRHGFTNIGSDPLQMLVGVTPGGFEGFFIDQNKPVIDRNNPPAPEQDLSVIAKLSQKYGTELALDPATPSKGLTSLDFLITNRNTPGRASFNQDGEVYTSLANNQETGGQLSLFDIGFAPNSGSANLVSDRDAQSFYILDGNVTFQIGNKTTIGTPGTYIYLPKETPYTLQNLGNTSARALLLKTPIAVPEPTFTLGLLAFGAFSLTSLVKRRQKPEFSIKEINI